jgi:ribose/xylose/arabinose/galactoside ABC-type transport system permease subunit
VRKAVSSLRSATAVQNFAAELSAEMRAMRSWLRSQHLPLAATIFVLALLFSIASLRYEGFFSWRVVANIFGDNAFLGIAAVGMTFVILAGGIDLSVGSVLAFTTIFVATSSSIALSRPSWRFPWRWPSGQPSARAWAF